MVGGITHLGGKLLTQGQSALQQGVDMGKDLQNKVTTTVENQLPSGQNPSLEASASLPQEATSSPDQASSPVLAEGSASPSEEVPIPEGNVVSSSAVDSVSMQAFQPSTPVVQPETESVSSVQSETDSASSAQVPQEETKPSGLL